MGGALIDFPLEKPLMVPKGRLGGAGFVSSTSTAALVCAGAGLGDLAGLDGNGGGKLGRAGGAGDEVLLTARASCALAACFAL